MNRSLAFADRGSTFRLQRLSLQNGSFTTALDPTVEHELKRLDDLLAKRVLNLDATDEETSAFDEGSGDEEELGDMIDEGGAIAADGGDPAELLARSLQPWRPKSGAVGAGWPRGSLLDALTKTPDNAAFVNFSDFVNDGDPALAELAYDVKDQLASSRWRLDPNVRAVLDGHDAVRDYLIARAWVVGRIRDADAMVHYLLGNRSGVKGVIDYIAVSAARAYVEAQRLRVPEYIEDGKPFSLQVKASAPSFAKAAFVPAIKAIADDIMFNGDAGKLIDESGMGPFSASIRAKLVAMIKSYPVKITSANVKYFLPHLIAQAYDLEPATVTDPAVPMGDDRGWKVQFQDTIDQEVDVDRGAVHYAAQLFHGMVMGDELGLFDAVEYLIHSRMVVGGGMSAADRALRDDLKLYALSNEFRDLGAPGQPIEERTRASERKMFARAVFDQGDGELMEGMQRNTEIRSLWQVLMLESARYLDRAQESYNPESFVSKQNVMQAVEDLQYNLSTYCIGWPQVIAPVVDAEVNFVLTRFLRNPSVAQQVLPSGGSWKRVLDKLNTERPKKKPVRAATLLYAKAKQGAAIIEAIANYDPAAFEDESNFSSFISLVDGYITTESKLQPSRQRRDADSERHDDGEEKAPRPPREPVANDDDDTMSADHDRAAAAGGWDF